MASVHPPMKATVLKTVRNKWRNPWLAASMRAVDFILALSGGRSLKRHDGHPELIGGGMKASDAG